MLHKLCVQVFVTHLCIGCRAVELCFCVEVYKSILLCIQNTVLNKVAAWMEMFHSLSVVQNLFQDNFGKNCRSQLPICCICEKSSLLKVG